MCARGGNILCARGGNVLLMEAFSPKEVKQTIFSMGVDKSLGVEGLNPGFF